MAIPTFSPLLKRGLCVGDLHFADLRDADLHFQSPIKAGPLCWLLAAGTGFGNECFFQSPIKAGPLCWSYSDWPLQWWYAQSFSPLLKRGLCVGR